MPAVKIESVDDPRITAYRDLPSRSLRQEAGFVVEGAWLVERLLKSDLEVESAFVENGRAEEFAAQMDDRIPVYTADKRLFEEIVGFDFHRCVMAIGRRKSLLSVSQLVPMLPQASTVVIAEGISDPENLGGLLRNCAAFGVDGVVIGPKCADPFSRRVLRVGMGNSFQLRLAQSENLLRGLQILRDTGFEIVASVLNPDAKTLEDLQRSERVALLFGNEANGLSDEVIQISDHRVTIPMHLGTDSLNIAVASGIFLFQYRIRS